MNLESSKNLGGIGAILVVIGCIAVFASGYAGLLIALIGVILTLIALKGISDHYNDAGIFNNALYGCILAIIGVVACIATMAVMVLAEISKIDIDWTDAAAVQRYFMDMNNVWGILAAVIAALVILFVFAIISAIFVRKSLTRLSMKSGEKMFETAGLLWLIGAVLTIVLVGFLLIVIAWILIAVGFFSIKTTTTQPSTAQPPPPT